MHYYFREILQNHHSFASFDPPKKNGNVLTPGSMEPVNDEIGDVQQQ